VALGEGDVKTVEDLAGLVPDDMRGWFETKNGERVREPGILESFNLSPEDAEALIMRARIVMGWVEAPPEPEYEPEAEYEGDVEGEVEGEAAPEEAAGEETVAEEAVVEGAAPEEEA
jgi:N utilization substance protein A